MPTLRTWTMGLVGTLFALLILTILALMIYQKFSDGPTGPLMGGTFTSGEVIQTPLNDWSALNGSFEFELVAQGSSRTAGGMVIDGDLYITCDLGFVWSRLPSGVEKNLLNVIWWFKTWHKDASEDGRIRIRKDGKIYPATIERVFDEALIASLKDELEVLAAEFFAPNPIGPRPTEKPMDIWFFKVSQR